MGDVDESLIGVCSRKNRIGIRHIEYRESQRKVDVNCHLEIIFSFFSYMGKTFCRGLGVGGANVLM